MHKSYQSPRLKLPVTPLEHVLQGWLILGAGFLIWLACWLVDWLPPWPGLFKALLPHQTDEVRLVAMFFAAVALGELAIQPLVFDIQVGNHRGQAIKLLRARILLRAGFAFAPALYLAVVVLLGRD